MEAREGEGEPTSVDFLPESMEWRPRPMPLDKDVKVPERRPGAGLDEASLSLLAPELEPLRGFRLVRAFFNDMLTGAVDERARHRV